LSNPLRYANREALYDVLNGLVRAHPSAYWTQLLKQHDILHAPVRDYNEVLAHPQAVHLEMAQQLEQAGVGTLPYIGLPTHPHHRQVSAAPRIGEHSIAILQGAGIDAQRIDQLIAQGVVAQSR